MALQPFLHLLYSTYDKLIPWLRLGRINRMSWQFQHTLRLGLPRRDTELREVLDGMDDAVVGVKIDQVKRKKNSQGMNPSRRHHPDPTARAQTPAPDQSLE